MRIPWRVRRIEEEEKRKATGKRAFNTLDIASE